MRRQIARCFGALALLGAILPVASAQQAAIGTFANDTGQFAADLHITLGNVGVPPIITVDPVTITQIDNCPPPLISFVGTTVVVDWGIACVPPDAKITIMMVTPNAPPGGPTLVNCFWTDINHVNIGPCGNCGFQAITIGGGGGPILGAWKVQTRYRPLGPIGYTKWRHRAGRSCWWRWCCNPWGWVCEFRIVYCPFSTRFTRFWEVPPWIPVTRWIQGKTLAPAYWWQRTTITPPPNERIDGAWAGAPPAADITEWGWHYDLTTYYSDDLSQPLHEVNDFASTAYGAWRALQITAPLDPNGMDPNGPPAPSDFVPLLQFVGPGYVQAGNEFIALRNEIDDVRVHEPNPLMDQVRVDVEIIGLSLMSIGNNWSAGVTGPMPLYIQLQSGVQNLSNHMIQVAAQTGSQRYLNASATLQSMRQGVDEAINQLALGLPDPCSQDLFTWGMMSRFNESLRHLGSACMPHIRLHLNLGNYHWYGSSVAGAQVTTQDMASDEIVDIESTPVSDMETIDVVQIDGAATPVRLRVKLPTHLSRVVEIPAPFDGMNIVLPPLIQGDANGDNCVDALDLQLVLDAQGQGGPDAEHIPSADVDGSGLVDGDDLLIVQANQGQCGEELTIPPVCLGDVDNDYDVDITDVALLLASFGSTSGNPSYNPAADFDDDGDVDITDLAVQLSEFGTVCTTLVGSRGVGSGGSALPLRP